MLCSPSGRGRTCHSDGVISGASNSNWQPIRTSIDRAWLAGKNLSLLLYVHCVNLPSSRPVLSYGATHFAEIRACRARSMTNGSRGCESKPDQDRPDEAPSEARAWPSYSEHGRNGRRATSPGSSFIGNDRPTIRATAHPAQPVALTTGSTL